MVADPFYRVGRVSGMSGVLREARWLVRNLSRRDRADISDAALESLASSIQPQSLSRGQFLYEEGRIPAGVWAIRSGRIDLSSRVGGRRSIVQILREGAIAGDLPVLMESPSLSTAHVGEEGAFLFVEAQALRELLEKHGDLAFLWLHNVILELKEARVRILQLLGADLAQSVARLLLSEQSDDRVELPQLAIAELLGVQRTSVNRVLMALRKSGIVDVSYSSVLIKDRAALSAIAFGGEETASEVGGPAEDAG